MKSEKYIIIVKVLFILLILVALSIVLIVLLFIFTDDTKSPIINFINMVNNKSSISAILSDNTFFYMLLYLTLFIVDILSIMYFLQLYIIYNQELRSYLDYDITVIYIKTVQKYSRRYLLWSFIFALSSLLWIVIFISISNDIIKNLRIEDMVSNFTVILFKLIATLTVSSPIIWVTFESRRRMNNAEYLIEEYTHKLSVTKIYNEFKKNDSGQFDTKFIENILKVYCTSPVEHKKLQPREPILGGLLSRKYDKRILEIAQLIKSLTKQS
jgi:hypothetical protein